MIAVLPFANSFCAHFLIHSFLELDDIGSQIISERFFNEASAEYLVILIKYGRLAGSDSILWLFELYPGGIILTWIKHGSCSPVIVTNRRSDLCRLDKRGTAGEVYASNFASSGEDFFFRADHYLVREALRWGQIHALGGDERLVDALRGTPLAKDCRDNDFSLSLIRFFIRHPMLVVKSAQWGARRGRG